MRMYETLARHLPEQGRGKAALGAGLAGLLLAVLTGAIVSLPVVVQLAVVAGACAVLITLARPGLMITVFFLGRILMDLLWWVPGSFGSLNIMEMYTGGSWWPTGWRLWVLSG